MTSEPDPPSNPVDADARVAAVADCLRRISAGGPDAERVEPELYGELRAIAGALLRSAKSGHTLQPTALVHEAWLKVANLEPSAERTRKQYLALAAKAMRSVLVDHARSKASERHGGAARRETLNEVSTASDVEAEELIDLDEVLAEFEGVDPARARIVELLFFGGLTTAEAADVLGLSTRSVERGWAAARAWLHRRMRERGSEPR